MANPARRRLVLIAAVQVLAMATWFAASAVVPALRVEWSMSDGQATWLTASVQLGFVCGAVTSAVMNLPHRLPTRRLMGVSAGCAAAANAAVALWADGLELAVPLRFLTGVALAGVYPPGLKRMASWFYRGRGLALGVLVAALTVGSALPHLISGLAALPWRDTLFAACGLAVAGDALSVFFLRPGPYAAPFAPSHVITVLRQRRSRLANLGYFGHMWELQAMWTWLPTYFPASQAARGAGGTTSTASVTAFVAIGIAGVIGCLLGSALGDCIGRFRRRPAR